MKRIALLLLLFWTALVASAATKTSKLVLNKGQLLTVDAVLVPYYAFNADTVFDQTNERIKMAVGDTLNLTVVNHTADTQQFIIEDFQISQTIPSGDSIVVELVGKQPGVHIYSGGKTGKQIAYWGASGMLVVTSLADANKATFYWNLKDFELNKVLDLDSGKSVDWSTLYPDYFLVNGKGKPQLVGDVASNVKGSVGQSILIMVTNTGKVNHSIHFHGFHATAVEGKSKRVQKGSIKDTFPIETGDALMLLLVPDKTGIYPVHDHNLIAVAGGGKYPNGVFMIIDIK